MFVVHDGMIVAASEIRYILWYDCSSEILCTLSYYGMVVAGEILVHYGMVVAVNPCTLWHDCSNEILVHYGMVVAMKSLYIMAWL